MGNAVECCYITGEECEDPEDEYGDRCIYYEEPCGEMRDGEGVVCCKCCCRRDVCYNDPFTE